jgi:methionine-rich copper-binding protein CopC
MKRFIAPVVLVVFLLSAASALAHIVPVGCVPRPGVTLEQAPPQVLCLFSGVLDLNGSDLQVFDAQGNRVDEGNAVPFQGDPTSLIVTLDPAKMGDGIYTVRWITNDFIDTDIISGTVEFGINTVVPPTPTAVLPGVLMTPQAVPSETNTGNAAGELISRFLIAAGVALLAIMGFLFWRLRRSDTTSVEEDAP